MKTLKRKVVLCALLAFAALKINAQNIKKSELNSNYNTVIFPNNSDVVGKIFGVKNGKVIPITTLEVPTKSSNIVIGDYTKTKNFTWGMIWTFLGISDKNVSGNVNFNEKKDVVKSISYKDTKQYTMDLLAADKLIREKRIELNNFANANDLRGMKFYLIIENITAKQVEYGLNKKVTGKDSINVNLNQIGNLNPSVSYHSNTDYQIHYQLPNELSVLYSILPLKPPVAQLTGDDFFLTVDGKKREILTINYEL